MIAVGVLQGHKNIVPNPDNTRGNESFLMTRYLRNILNDGQVLSN